MTLTHEESDELQLKLIGLGYKKYVQHYKSETYLYWKSFDRNDDSSGGYSCGIAFYDFSKYPQHIGNPISISFEFMLGNNENVDRMDLTISDDKITIEKFESFCKEFFDFLKSAKL